MTDSPELEAVVDALLVALTAQAGDSGGAHFARSLLEEPTEQPREALADRPVELAAAIDALLIALAERAGETGGAHFARRALEKLADLPRQALKRLLGSIGHLIHYGCPSDPEYAGLTHLFEELVATLRRGSDRGPTGLRPGDIVELTVDRLKDQLRAGTAMRVYFVGDDGTADLGLESLVDEYLVYSVELEQLRATTVVSPET